ncbi:hypothetical protein, partial [Salmonella enterica]|uniref:hypothetical protein n=1 Tax=Salmonella enterica TaxID=28901 RepID=UPI000A70A5E4
DPFPGPYIKLSLASELTLFFLLNQSVASNTMFLISHKEPLYFCYDNIPVYLELFGQTFQE